MLNLSKEVSIFGHIHLTRRHGKYDLVGLQVCEPTGPLDVYKAIIDHIVGETRLFGSSSRVAERGIYSNAPAHRKYNEFIGQLSPHQRELLSRMLQGERNGTIHGKNSVLRVNPAADDG
jgi:hypothetical protein